MTEALTQAARLLKALIFYLSLNWAVFPCKHDKKPFTKNGLKDASSDLEQVKRWWVKHPEAMIGVRTGAGSGIFVVDIDVDESKGIDGTKWLQEYEEKYGPLPHGPRAITPRRGQHLYFRYPTDRTVRNSAGKIAPGVDVRGEGGYVIAPPSKTGMGKYVWHVAPSDYPVLEAPQPLLDLVCDPEQPPPSEGALAVVDVPLTDDDKRLVSAEIDRLLRSVAHAKQGTRNHTLNRAAFVGGKLIGANAVSEADLTAQLLQAAEIAGLSQREATATIRSGIKAGKLRPWRPNATSPQLAALNRDHFFALDGRIGFIFREEVDPQIGHRSLAHITPGAFKDLFGNQFEYTAGGRMIPLGKAWLSWGGRRQYLKIAFAPGRELHPSIYNLWQGFAVEAVEGDCKSFLDFIRDFICARDNEVFNYLIRWMAYAVQRPWTPGEVAIVLRGEKGIGKSFFASHFGELFGEHFVSLSNSQHLVGHFNAHLETAIVVFAEEAFWAGDKQGEGTLKALITERWLRIERKGVDSKTVPNRIHLLMSSNSEWVAPASLDERRFAVLNPSPEMQEHYKYFEQLETDWQNGCREAFLHYLLTLDISEFNVRRAPKTAALLEQKLLSLPAVDRWFLSLLQEGGNMYGHDNTFMRGAGGQKIALRWAEWVATYELFELCKDFCKEENVRSVITREAFGMRLSTLLPPRADGRSRRTQRQFPEDKRLWGYEFPPLEECRQYFEKKIGHPIEWVTVGEVPGAPPTKY